MLLVKVLYNKAPFIPGGTLRLGENIWKRSGGDQAKNVDLWERLHSHQENERCEQFLTKSACLIR
jgi:hypothetical protein